MIKFCKEGIEIVVEREENSFFCFFNSQKIKVSHTMIDPKGNKVLFLSKIINFAGKKVKGFIVDDEVFEKVRELERMIEEEKRKREEEEERKEKERMAKIKISKIRTFSTWADGYYPSTTNGMTAIGENGEKDIENEEGERFMQILRFADKEGLLDWGKGKPQEGVGDPSYYEFDVEYLKEFEEKYEEYVKEEERKEKERKEREEKKKEELKKKQEEALKKAKETGRDVFIRDLGMYDGDEAHPGEELGWVSVSEWATPDGRIIEKESPSY